MALTQVIKLEGDASGFNKTVAKTGDATQKAFAGLSRELATRFLKVPGAAQIVDFFITQAKKTADMAMEVSDLSRNLNISAEDTQRLGIVSRQTGTEMDKLAGAISAVNELKAAAYQYDPEAMRKFAMMGIDPKKGTMEIIKTMSQAKGQAAIVVDNVFGMYAKQIKETFQKMERMGPQSIQLQPEINAIKQLKDTIDELNRVLTVQFTPIVVLLNTVLQGFLNGLQSTASMVDKILKGTATKQDFLSFFAQQSTVAAQMMLPFAKFAKEGAVGSYEANKPGTPPLGMPTYAPADMAAKGGALNRIGLFVGGAPNIGDRLVTIGGFQLTQLRLIRGELEKMNQ